MPGIATGIPGAKAYDEVLEQSRLIQTIQFNNGKPPDKQILIEPETSNEFRVSVLRALGVSQSIAEEA